MSEITLTIDNGPHPEVTPQVLQVLKQTQVPAHFFVVGRQVAKTGGVELIERIRRDEHLIGNHTWSHGTPFGDNRDPNAISDEVERTRELLGDYLGEPPLFRPVGGGGRLDGCLFSPALIDHLVAARYTCVLWNVVPRDWEDPEGWVATALTQVAAADRSVVVVHDVLRGNAERIGEFIELARLQGHEFVATVDPGCVPIVGGEIRADLSEYTTRMTSA